LRRTGAYFVLCAIAATAQPAPTQALHPAVDPEHDLTTGEFFRDLGLNFVGIAHVRNVPALLGGAAAVSLSTIPEQRLEAHFSRGDMWGGWSTPGKYVGHPLILGGLSTVLFAASRKSDDTKFRSLAYSLMQGTLVVAGIVHPTKAGFHRLRPNGEDHSSFPSGHAADSFLYATVLTEHYGWKAALPGYAVASYVAATRMEERKHHLTDIAAGAAIGYLVGKTVTRRARSGTTSRLTWQVFPTHRGFAGSLRVLLP
jgi:membrane-associated phospholipid phosphatase